MAQQPRLLPLTCRASVLAKDTSGVIAPVVALVGVPIPHLTPVRPMIPLPVQAKAENGAHRNTAEPAGALTRHKILPVQSMTKQLAWPKAAVGALRPAAVAAGALPALLKNALLIMKPIAKPKAKHGAYLQALQLLAAGALAIVLTLPLPKLMPKPLAPIPAINGA